MALPFENVLIVTASVGAGHDQAARAVGAEIGERYPGVRVTIADFMGEENSYLNALLKETYLKMISVSPQVYDLLYRWSQTHQLPVVQTLLAKAMKRSMRRLYFRYRPDLIIFTHPFPCGAAAYLRRKGLLDAPLVGVVTDFSAHPLWVYDEVDLYFVAAGETRNELVRQGVPAERICPTGIPIDVSFGRQPDRSAAMRELGLAALQPTVLIMGGGLGIGPVADAVRSLDGVGGGLQIVVVAGRNAELRRELRAIAAASRHYIVALGYTRRVRELMAAADLLITKPGALTVSEGLSAGLPMVLISPLPGQEEDNAAYLVDRGAAVLLADARDAGAMVAGLLARPQELEEMRGRARGLGHPWAASVAAGIIGSRLAARRGAAAGVRRV
ncbi:MGDG synthase family glycosyltransferase [Anaeroselena agilis]|uniref:Glycosyltransferase n=1 Tax=Anaeroselena agilis TaxID=3063788 RepID=A0ABU3P3T6_9FIRM|nr:glycosyltransferase [Selenomonadales bacterium 4137-cl]